MGLFDMFRLHKTGPEPATAEPTLADIDPDDEDAMQRWAERQVQDGLARVRANTREMQAKGILDQEGNLVDKDLPAEMLSGDRPCDIP